VLPKKKYQLKSKILYNITIYSLFGIKTRSKKEKIDIQKVDKKETYSTAHKPSTAKSVIARISHPVKSIHSNYGCKSERPSNRPQSTRQVALKSEIIKELE